MIDTRSPLRVATPTSGVLLAAAAGWVGVIVFAGDMGVMPGTMGFGFASFLAVWTLMMTAMMLPSVMPVAALYTRTMVDGRGRRLAFYTGGYLLVWVAAGIAAYVLASLAGWAVDGDGAAATGFAVVLFAACGVYQLTPLKDRCLARCRSPLGFLMRYSAYEGPTRDVRVGVHHGAFCLGCCWSLMALLVAFGLMNVAAMIGVASVVLIEKAWGRGPVFARAVGVAALVLAILVAWWPGLAPGLQSGSHMAGM